ncbi:MAG TPA: hypothetical protein VGL84_07890 [Gaiellaceae bacterium]|jgi:hypothetical protein
MQIAVRARTQSLEVVICALLASALASVAVVVVPAGGDLAAHLYRTALVQHGVLIWDNLWFAGQYPLSSYSLLYYPLAAVVGNAALGVIGAVAAAAIFASIAEREWLAAGRWPARVFAILVAGQVFTAAYPYDMGMAALLAAIWALQRRHAWLAALCVLLTLGFSPLAFLLLVLALTALWLRKRRIDRQALTVAAAVALSAALELVVLTVMPSPGLFYPYGTWRLLAGLAVAAVGVAVSFRGRGRWPLASIFIVWAAATIVADVVPSPVGHNLIRASVFVPSLMLVGAALADFRPRWLTITAVAAAFAANVLPYTAMIAVRSTSVDATAAFWRPVVKFLSAHNTPGFRIEVVPTANHWEAYYLPRAGFALARGWYRQLDIADDPALYAPTLTPAGYRAWLLARGVHYVVLPHLALEAIDAAREASLVQTPATGLRKVFVSTSATVYKLRGAKPILIGPGKPTVTTFNSNEIAGRVTATGRYLLRVHFTPYWDARGPVCVAPAANDMTLVEASRPGAFALQAIESPGGIVSSLLDAQNAQCP